MDAVAQFIRIDPGTFILMWGAAVVVPLLIAEILLWKQQK